VLGVPLQSSRLVRCKPVIGNELDALGYRLSAPPTLVKFSDYFLFAGSAKFSNSLKINLDSQVSLSVQNVNAD
jgi:hypothetical protein